MLDLLPDSYCEQGGKYGRKCMNARLDPNFPQTLLDQVKADLNLTQGEVNMWIPDMPNVPPQNVPVMIAQANQAQASDTTKIRTIGVCHPAPNNNYSADNGLIPITSAGYYLQAFEQRNPPGSATATILQQPKHGVLRLVTQADVGTILPSGGDPVDPAAALYFYLPEAGYVGKDNATIQVDFGGGLKVNVKYYFQALSQGLGDDWVGDYCKKTGPYWKISSTLNPDGTNTLTSVEYQSPVPSAADQTATAAAALASTLGLNFTTGTNAPGSSTAPASVTLNLADLAGGAVGHKKSRGQALHFTEQGVKGVSI